MGRDMDGFNLQQAATGPVRRLSDRIEQAFDQACRQGQLEVAACMLKGLDLALLGQPTPWDRRQAALSLLRSSHDRLERLRASVGETGFHPGATLRMMEPALP